MVVFYVEDSQPQFKESEHPRDNGGKFSTTQGGGGPSGQQTTKYVPNNNVKKTLAEHGFKSVGYENGMPTFKHPSGLKVVVHPTPGQKGSSKWATHHESNETKGEKAAKLDALLKKITHQNVVQLHEPKPEASKEEPKSAVKTGLSASLAEKGYGPASSNVIGGSIIYSKPNGAKIEYTPETGEWIASTPGHMTKEGIGKENLDKLLSGQPIILAPGETAPFKNTSKTVGMTEAEKSAAQEKAKAAHAAQEKAKAAESKWVDMAIYAPTATESQKSALSSYCGNGYSTINDICRHNPKEADSNSTVKNLDAYLKESKLPEDVTLYRGVRGNYAKILKSIMFEGGKFVDRGYSSTSMSNEISFFSGGGLKLEIRAKKGQRGASLANYNHHKGEKEVLLPRNTMYHVISFNQETGYAVVEIEQKGD